MRVEVRFDTDTKEYKPILTVVLYTKTDEEHEKDGCNSGVYQCSCASNMFEDLHVLCSRIELNLNQCFRLHQEEQAKYD